MDKLPSDIKEKFKLICLEGQLIAKTSFLAGLDSADTGPRLMVTGVTMRRDSRLSTLGPHKEVQRTLQDLPFDGKELFN